MQPSSLNLKYDSDGRHCAKGISGYGKLVKCQSRPSSVFFFPAYLSHSFTKSRFVLSCTILRRSCKNWCSSVAMVQCKGIFAAFTEMVRSRRTNYVIGTLQNCRETSSCFLPYCKRTTNMYLPVVQHIDDTKAGKERTLCCCYPRPSRPAITREKLVLTCISSESGSLVFTHFS